MIFGISCFLYNIYDNVRTQICGCYSSCIVHTVRKSQKKKHSAYNVDAVLPRFYTLDVLLIHHPFFVFLNHHFCIFSTGVPAMFVTAWATVRATFADTEWVKIKGNILSRFNAKHKKKKRKSSPKHFGRRAENSSLHFSWSLSKAVSRQLPPNCPSSLNYFQTAVRTGRTVKQ